MKVHVERSGENALVSECQQAEEIRGLQEKLYDVDKALFRGNGQPSIVAQTATNTQAISALTRIAWITLTAVIGEFVLLVFKIFLGGAAPPGIEAALNDLSGQVQELNREVKGCEAPKKRGGHE